MNAETFETLQKANPAPWNGTQRTDQPADTRHDQKEITTMTEPAILFASTKRLDAAADSDWDAWETEQAALAQKARDEISASLATVTETLNKLAEKSTQIDESSKEVKTVSENVDYRKNKLSNQEAIFKEKDHLWILAEALPEDERKEIVYMIDHLPGEIMNHEQLQRLHMEVTLLELLPEVGRMTPAIQEALDSLETVYAAIKKVWFEARHAL